MGLKEFGIGVIRSILSMLIFSLIFVSVSDFDTKDMLKNVFDDIYEYSDDAAKQQVITKLNNVCTPIIKNEEALITFDDMCNDEEKINKLKEDCITYFDLKKNKQVQTNQEFEESCAQISSSDFEKACEQIKSGSDIDKTGIKNACLDYNNGKINDEQFFKLFLEKSTPESKVNFNKFISKQNMFLILVAILLFLIILILLHKGNFMSISSSIGKILMSLGILFVLSFSIPYFYNMFFPPDTTSILESISAASTDIYQQAIKTLLPLIFASIFKIKFLIIGSVLFLLGLALRITAKKKEE